MSASVFFTRPDDNAAAAALLLLVWLGVVHVRLRANGALYDYYYAEGTASSQAFDYPVRVRAGEDGTLRLPAALLARASAVPDTSERWREQLGWAHLLSEHAAALFLGLGVWTWSIASRTDGLLIAGPGATLLGTLLAREVRGILAQQREHSAQRLGRLNAARRVFFHVHVAAAAALVTLCVLDAALSGSAADAWIWCGAGFMVLHLLTLLYVDLRQLKPT